MINVSEKELNIIIDLLKEYVPFSQVRAFGSRYKQTNRQFSDLDLAIVSNQKMTMMELAELSEAFSESDLPFRVDLLDYQAVSDEFRTVIEEGYEVIWNGGDWS